MIIRSVSFVGSYPDYQLAPQNALAEFAFIGRSNVGKSSLINMLVQRNDLARTSNVPGKTQTLNYYNINDGWFLVDLPGYGYAKVAQRMRKQWEQMMKKYMLHREQLCCIMALIDGTITPQRIDLEFIDWLGENGLPFVIVFTKTDRVKPHELEANVAKFNEKLLENWEELPPHFITSATRGTGRDEVMAFIEDTITVFENNL